MFLFPPLTLNSSHEHDDKEGSGNGSHLDHQQSDECTLNLLPVSRSKATPEVGEKEINMRNIFIDLQWQNSQLLKSLLRL